MKTILTAVLTILATYAWGEEFLLKTENNQYRLDISSFCEPTLGSAIDISIIEHREAMIRTGTKPNLLHLPDCKFASVSDWSSIPVNQTIPMLWIRQSEEKIPPNFSDRQLMDGLEKFLQESIGEIINSDEVKSKISNLNKETGLEQEIVNAFVIYDNRFPTMASINTSVVEGITRSEFVLLVYIAHDRELIQLYTSFALAQYNSRYSDALKMLNKIALSISNG